MPDLAMELIHMKQQLAAAKADWRNAITMRDGATKQLADMTAERDRLLKISNQLLAGPWTPVEEGR